MMFNANLVAVVKVDGKVLREVNGVVRLPFNSNYSILLKNLNTVKAVVKIDIDNEDILDGASLIIAPKEDLELKRWLVGSDESGPALKFIEKTDQIREARGENDGMDGIVRITYQFEEVVVTSQKPVKWVDNPYCDPYERHYDGTAKDYYPMPFYYSDSTPIGPQTQQPTRDILRSVHNSNITNIVNTTITQGTFDVDCYSNSTLLNEAVVCDEGMTIKGEDFDQAFTPGFTRRLCSDEFVITFQLRGSTKKVTVNDKKICSKCNTKNPHNSNFCSCCGNNLK